MSLPPPDSSHRSARRRVLLLGLGAGVSLVAGSLSAMLGAFMLRPPRFRSKDGWVRAGATSTLKKDLPVPRVVTVSRVDGWYRERSRRTVFLVWDGGTSVRALSATCTHLGCQVGWHTESKTFICPCHGGVFNARGEVVSGPPPRPLDTLSTQVLENGDVMVRL